MTSTLLSLPLELLSRILDEVVIALKTKHALRLRLVNKQFAREIFYTVCKPGHTDVTREAFSDTNGRLEHTSNVFHAGLILPRLDLRYAAQSCYLSNILGAEEILMKQSPGQTVKERHDFRYALCGAERWWARDVLLADIEPISPQNTHPVDETSRLAAALSAASSMGNLDLVQKLLEQGADLNHATGYLRPPLQQAASRGYNDMLLFLLSKGADITIGYRRPEGSNDCGALVYASLHGHKSTMDLIRDRVSHVQPDLLKYTNVTTPLLKGGHWNLVVMTLKTDVSTWIKTQPRGSLNALDCAAQFGHENIVRCLLLNGVDVTKNDHPYCLDMDRTALDIAALTGRTSIVRLLLEYGANRHCPALAKAASRGHIEVAKLLLDTPGQDVDTRRMLYGKRPFIKWHRNYEKPMQCAVQHGEVEMVRFLLGRGLRRNLPVRYAAERGEEGSCDCS